MKTENAKLLWGKYHYGKNRYNMDVKEDDPYYNEIVSKKDMFPGGDSELLINKVLDEIDQRIAEVINESSNYQCLDDNSGITFCDINFKDFAMNVINN